MTKTCKVLRNESIGTYSINYSTFYDPSSILVLVEMKMTESPENILLSSNSIYKMFSALVGNHKIDRSTFVAFCSFFPGSFTVFHIGQTTKKLQSWRTVLFFIRADNKKALELENRKISSYFGLILI